MRFLLLGLGWLIFIFFPAEQNHSITTYTIHWKTLLPGLSIAEIQNPYHSKISDNIVTLIKVSPEYFDIDLYSAVAIDSVKRKAMEWAEDFNLQLVVNAGMYSLSDTYRSAGFMKQKGIVVEPAFKDNFKVMALFGASGSINQPFELLDLENEDTSGILSNYASAFQSIRMIDCRGQQVIWKPKRLLYSSMCVLGKDVENNAIIAFTRTPMSANQMSSLLIRLPINIRTTMYLEGGPEACFYIKTIDTVITKIGSYVSYTFPTDTNTRYWNLPNVIGFRFKEKVE